MSNSPHAELPGTGRRPAAPGADQRHYRPLASLAQVREVLDANKGVRRVAVHVLHDAGSLIGGEVLGVAFCFEPGVAWYVPASRDSGEHGDDPVGELRPLLASSGSPPKVAHDAKPALVLLRQRGEDLEPLGFDTSLAAFLLNHEESSIEDLAASRLGERLAERAPGGGDPARGAVEECAAYSCGRADAALRLCELFEPELEERGQLEYLLGLELPLASVLADMELAGIRVDTDALAKLSRDLDRRLRSLEAEMHELAGYEFNPKSSSQLGKLLYENLGLEGTRKTARGYSTDVYALEALAGSHPIVEKLLTYRRLSKLKDTYVDTLPQLVNPRTGRVHTSFSQTATSTGRLSSSDPNLQNIPVRTPEGRKVRRAFVAGDAGAVLLSADYSQIELRVLAHVSGERRLVDAFARGDDVHALTAADLYGVSPGAVTPEMRRVGKAVNYGVIYGMTGYRLARDTGLERREATEFVKRHSKLYPAIRAYFEETLRSAEEKGYVETPLGRRRYLPDLRASDRQRRQAARRAAENMPNQGMTADIIKRAMIEVHARLRERGLRARMLLQVHDELLLEAPEAELEEVAELVTREMRWAAKLDVPLEVEAKYGPNWADMRPLGGGTDGETP